MNKNIFRIFSLLLNIGFPNVYSSPSVVYIQIAAMLEVKKIFRFLLLILALILLCYQIKFAIQSIMNPPTIVTSHQVPISEITAPLIYICPLDQFNTTLMQQFGYENEYALFDGRSKTKTSRSWGSHVNKTFRQLVTNILNYSPELIDQTIVVSPRNIKVTPKLYPKFGFCYEVKSFDMDSYLKLRLDKFPNSEITLLLSDRSTKTFFSIETGSMLGDRIMVSPTKPTDFAFRVNVDVYEALPLKCNPDPDYSYELCVDKNVHSELKPWFSCIPPIFSDKDQCQTLSKEPVKDRGFYFLNFTEPYLMATETQAEKNCKKPCKQQRIKVTLRSQTTRPSNVSVLSLTFDQTVKIFKEMPNYGWFNFLVDMGSSLGTWAGLSAISLIDFGLYPVRTLKDMYKSL